MMFSKYYPPPVEPLAAPSSFAYEPKTWRRMPKNKNINLDFLGYISPQNFYESQTPTH